MDSTSEKPRYVAWNNSTGRCELCVPRGLDAESDLLSYIMRDSLATLILVTTAIAIEFVKEPNVLPVQLSPLTLLILTAMEFTFLIEMLKRSISVGNAFIEEAEVTFNRVSKLLQRKRKRRLEKKDKKRH